MRRFVAQQSELYSAPCGIAGLISALRGYLRLRATCGDRVHALIGVLISPPNWRQASLPQALSDSEVERLVASLGGKSPQFVDPARGSLMLQTLILGTLFIAVTFVVLGSIALGGSLLGKWLKDSKRAQSVLNRIAGTAFVGLAIKLART